MSGSLLSTAKYSTYRGFWNSCSGIVSCKYCITWSGSCGKNQADQNVWWRFWISLLLWWCVSVPEIHILSMRTWAYVVAWITRKALNSEKTAPSIYKYGKLLAMYLQERVYTILVIEMAHYLTLYLVWVHVNGLPLTTAVTFGVWTVHQIHQTLKMK